MLIFLNDFKPYEFVARIYAKMDKFFEEIKRDFP